MYQRVQNENDFSKVNLWLRREKFSQVTFLQLEPLLKNESHIQNLIGIIGCSKLLSRGNILKSMKKNLEI